jgi:hypothetical protein
MDQAQVEEWIEREYELREQLAESQIALIDAEIARIEAQTKMLEKGGMEVKISSVVSIRGRPFKNIGRRKGVSHMKMFIAGAVFIAFGTTMMEPWWLLWGLIKLLPFTMVILWNSFTKWKMYTGQAFIPVILIMMELNY